MVLFPSLTPALVSALYFWQAVRGLHIDITRHGHVSIDVELDAPAQKAKLPIHEYKDEDYQVDIPYQGKYQGHVIEKYGLKYVKFANIPYAAPPNNKDLRWATPLAPDEHEGVKDDDSPRMCPQAIPGWVKIAGDFAGSFSAREDLPDKWKKPITPADYAPMPSFGGSEDCLYLDVYVPMYVWGNRTNRGLQATWIHGGGFTYGSKNDIGNPIGLLQATNATGPDGGLDIVLFSINYRLGMFGWLGGYNYTDQGGYTNLGLWDQRMALEWVQNNMASFGAYNYLPTVMGESAGAASIVHHLTGWMSGRYRRSVPFSKAIIQSPGFNPQLISDKAADAVFKEIIDKAKVSDLEKLFEANETDLIKINAEIIYKSSYGQFTFGPSVDGYTVRNLPAADFANDDFVREVHILAGYNGLDGLVFTPPWIRDTAGLKNHVKQLFPNVSSDALNKIGDLYPIPPDGGNAAKAAKAQIAAVSEALNDVAIRCNVYSHTQALLRNTARNEFAFRFLYDAPLPIHGLDLNYLSRLYFFQFYPEKILPGAFPINETLANQTKQAWVDFIRYSDPNPEEAEDWKLYTNETRAIARFGHFQPGVPKIDFDRTFETDVMNDDARKRCDFWTSAPHLKKDGNYRSVEEILVQNEL